MNIFVISKFQSSSELLAIFLRMLGHNAAYSNIDTATRELQRSRFDILLLGCELSSAQSTRFARLFRKRNPHGCVIALAAEKDARPRFEADNVIDVSNGAPSLLLKIQATYQQARSARAIAAV
ncbi:MAG: hypothetical protein JWO20_2520 [Candidatus Angelobacter sp.]|jgi:DNA-binding response OmpR family regulator|nr:hypothetical protein [Candidatus Angelobacter sp.]